MGLFGFFNAIKIVLISGILATFHPIAPKDESLY